MEGKAIYKDKKLLSDKEFIQYFLLILLAGAAYRLFFITYFYGGDEVPYFNSMTFLMKNNLISNPFFPHSDFTVYQMHYMRLLLFLPSIFFIKLFGYSYTVAIIPIFLYSLGTIALIIFIGKRMYSPLIGLIAGGVMAFFPLSSLYSTVYTPDVPLTFYVTASWVSLVIGLNEKDRKKNLWWFALCGVCIHLAFSVKEPGILLIGSYFLFFCFVLSFSRESLRNIAIIGLFFIISFFVFGIFFYIFTGRYLYQTIFIGDHFGILKGIKKISSYIPGYIDSIPDNIGLRAFIKEYISYLVLIFLWDDTFALHGFLFSAGFVYFTIFRKNKLHHEKLMIYVVVFIFLYLNFGSAKLNKYIFLPKCQRYLLPIIPPVSIMSALLIQRMMENRLLKKTVYIILAVIFIQSVYITNGFCRYLENGNAFSSWIKAVRSVPNNTKPIFIAGNLVDHVKLFVEPAKRNRLRDVYELFNPDGTSDINKLKGSYLIYNDGYYYWRRRAVIPKEFNRDFFEYRKKLVPMKIFCETSTPLRDLMLAFGSKDIIGNLGSRKISNKHKVSLYKIPE